MENLLNDNLRECYLITGEVVVKYYELYEIMTDDTFKDFSLSSSFIFDVLEVVFKEYEIYRNLSLSDINMCLELIKNIDCDSFMVDARFKRKLETLKDVYEGIKINNKELNLDFNDKEIEFTLFVVISSLIDIEAMKKLKNKLDVILTDNYNDLLFVKSLYKQFNLILFNQTYSNSLTEVVNLSCGMDVSCVPLIDNKIIFDKINMMFGIENDNYFRPVDAALMEIAKVTVDRLVEVDFANNPKIVFNNLFFITRLEVLVSLMNKNSLINLLDYCEMFKARNSYGIDKVIKLIKDNDKFY